MLLELTKTIENKRSEKTRGREGVRRKGTRWRRRTRRRSLRWKEPSQEMKEGREEDKERQKQKRTCWLASWYGLGPSPAVWKKVGTLEEAWLSSPELCIGALLFA